MRAKGKAHSRGRVTRGLVVRVGISHLKRARVLRGVCSDEYIRGKIKEAALRLSEAVRVWLAELGKWGGVSLA